MDTLQNGVKHEVHEKAIKSEAESSFNHIVPITNIKAFIYPQLLAKKGH